MMRIITIAWEDGLSAKMFISWYRKTYCPSFQPPVLMLSSLNSEDILKERFDTAKENNPEGLMFVTIGIKSKHPDSRIPSFIMDESFLVLRLDRSLATKRLKSEEADDALIAEWDKYVKELSGAY